MSALLKADDRRAQTAIHPFTPGPTSEDSRPTAAPAPSAGERRIAELERDIATLTARIEQDASTAKAQIAAAFAEGREAGDAQAVTREEERLAALTKTLEAARQAHRAALERVEALALAVAQAALARVFGDRSRHAELVADSLRHQLAQLDRTLVTQIRVSPHDFADAAALSALAAQIPDIALQADPALATGDCAIDLQLGRIEAGMDEQWQRLSDLLDSLVTAESAS